MQDEQLSQSRRAIETANVNLDLDYVQHHVEMTPGEVAFGQGAHYCLGAPLARLEGQIAINTLLRRFPDLRLKVTPETLTWKPRLVLRGLHTLPLVF